MEGELKVLRNGSRVKIGGDIPAIVTGISIRMNDHVTYECSWLDGNQHHCKYLEACEVVAVDSPDLIRVGFLR